MLGYLIDMDGVIYRGQPLDPRGGPLHRRNCGPRTCRFCSSPTTASAPAATWRPSCNALGIDVEEEHVFTCAMATARFLAQQKPRRHGLRHRRRRPADCAARATATPSSTSDPDYVVVGEGRTLTFEMVEAALGMILGGAKLVATNLDPNCPTQTGMRPGCGAIVAMLEDGQPASRPSASASPARSCSAPPARSSG